MSKSELFIYRDKPYHLARYPRTTNKSLRVWNAGEAYLLQYLEGLNLANKQMALYHDRFGFLNTVLHQYHPIGVLQYSSQRQAWQMNFKKNGVEIDESKIISPLDTFPGQIDIACMKIPKSIDLFELFLRQLHPSLKEDGTVVCSFMTRHFNKKILSVAALYFEEIEQSKAWKKSRLLILKKKKKRIPEKDLLKTITLDKNQELKQYPGVFSGEKIDIATRFLLEDLALLPSDEKALDLAAGNGVIAHHLYQQNSKCELHLLDDDRLAIESAKLNLPQSNTHYHWADTTDALPDSYFDLIVCNPPFHFEYENTIEIALQLFRGAHRCLKKGGRFLIVANLHLNYKTHLERLFPRVVVLRENQRFIVYECGQN